MKSVQRKFSLGSEWLYIKIYTGYRTADELLTNELYFLINSLTKKKIIKKYFFIRYSDPLYHIRLRINIYNLDSLAEIIVRLNKIFQPKLNNNTITKIQYDTYNRELERYHNSLIEIVESIFFIDSVFIIKIINNIIVNQSEDNRWIAGIILITSFLDCSEISIEERYKLTQNLADGFKIEFGFDMYNSKQFNVLFRENKKTIEDAIEKKYFIDGFEDIYSYTAERHKNLSPLLFDVIKKCKDLNISHLKYFESYIHMTLNRLFPTKNRLHELLLYDLLSRYYKSTIIKGHIKSNDI